MSASQSSSQAQATKLKTEGNALFVKNDFSGAYAKYTQALKYDDKSAVLYSNRAACSLGLNRYMDACTDATKATELDPSYAKAWGRLAAAHAGLSRLDRAISAWKRAVDALPVGKLTSAEEKQEAQYKTELAKATAQFEELKANPRLISGTVQNTAQLPWNRAFAIIPELFSQRKWCSSAWVIGGAYRDWERAVTNMKLGRWVDDVCKGRGYFDHKGVIEGLSNALIADSRVFHISDPNFLEMYNNQMMFEIEATKPWSKSGSRDVMKEAPQRLAREGWNSVRPALSLTVRLWILRAFMDENLSENIETSLDFYTSVLELLTWGRELWQDVPDQDRGAIFRPTFIRGVRCMRLDAMMKIYEKHPGVQSRSLLEDLLVGATALLDELGDIPEFPDTADFGFFLSFCHYPAGQAYAIRGYYYHHIGRLAREAAGGNLTDEVVDLYTQAGHAYSKAADYYPPDDENRAWFLNCCVELHIEVGIPFKYLIVILDHIHMVIPQMKRVWEFSGNALYGRDAALAKAMKLRDDLLDIIKSGQATRDTMELFKLSQE